MTEGITHVADISTILMEGSSHQIGMEDILQIEDNSDLDELSENLTKVLIPSILEYQVSHSTKAKSTASNVKNSATCKKTVQN